MATTQGRSTITPDQVISGLSPLLAAAFPKAVAYLWQHLLHREPPGFLSTWAASLTSFITFVGVIAVYRLLHRYNTRHERRRHSKSNRDALTVYVATLVDDDITESSSTAIRRSIQSEFGRESIEVLNAGETFSLTPGLAEQEAVSKPTRSAQQFLSEVNGDLLIWGRVLRHNGRDHLELRFVSNASATDPRAETIFNADDKLLLDLEFTQEVGSALAARVALHAALAADQSDKYVADILIPQAASLRKLLTSLSPRVRPEDCALLFHSYGLLESRIADQSGDLERMKLAIEPFKRALEYISVEDYPHNWAASHSCLGAAYELIGEFTGNAALLEEAIEHYTRAADIYHRVNYLRGWANNKNNLGNSLAQLALITGNADQLQASITAYQDACIVRTRDNDPMVWARTRTNLGSTMTQLAELMQDVSLFKRATDIIVEALEEQSLNHNPLMWALSHEALGAVFQNLGKINKSAAELCLALEHYDECLKVYRPDHIPIGWARTQNGLGNTLVAIGVQTFDPHHIESAIAIYGAAIEVCNLKGATGLSRMLEHNIRSAESILAAFGPRSDGGKLN